MGEPEELVVKEFGDGEVVRIDRLEFTESSESPGTLRDQGDSDGAGMSPSDGDDNYNDIEFDTGGLKINVSPDKYAPWMSSARGFTLRPEWDEYFEDDNIEFVWSTDGGVLAESWLDIGEFEKELITSQPKGVYWTFADEWTDLVAKGKPVYIYLKIRQRDNDKIIEDAQVRLDWSDEQKGLIEVGD